MFFNYNYKYTDYYPLTIVYEFARACEDGEVYRLDSIMQQFVNQMMSNYFEQQAKMFEYEYAFWLSLEKAARTNQSETIKFIFEHPNFQIFKNNLSYMENSMNKLQEQYQKNKAYSEIDPTKALKNAAENCHFESFELLKELKVWNDDNIGEIYMGFYKKLKPYKIDSLLKITNIKEYTQKNIKKAIEHIVKEENIYSLRFIKEKLQIPISDISQSIREFMDSNAKADPQKIKFCELALLELSTQNKISKEKLIKI